jgi:hypothetical protein
MVSTVKSRPNYYEMLGLTPSAAGDAIAHAFARTTSAFRPHAFGGITELCIAYETLRDPAKRRAYDESLGLAPEPKIPPVTLPASAHFMQRPAVAFVAPPEPKGEPKRQEPVVQRPTVAIAPPPEPKVGPKPPEPVMRRPVQLDSPMSRQLAFSEVNVGVRPIEWKRTGTIVGGLAAAAVFVGVFIGWWSGSSAEASDQPQRAVSAARQPEKPLPTFSELWPEPAPSAVEARADQPRRAVATRSRVQRNSHRPQLAASEAESQLIQPPPELADSAAADPLAPEAAPAPPVAASMPLPHKAVARTIDRIGYSCGQVASAMPVDGAAGVYKVTCTSGQSFQAKPVNGRYRFRRVAKN